MRPRPVELTPAELDLAHHPVTKASQPIAVTAWVRFHEATIHPVADASAWNDRALQVRWPIGNAAGDFLTAWVWAGAGERR